MNAAVRRYDLDWLRVIAFAILIFYHIGMFYVTWGWHVKSPHAGPAIELPMVLVNSWRLALLFFISGIALRYAADKAPLARLAGRRFLRLAAPIVFGMAVIVAPQSYYELRSQGVIEPGFWAFYPDYLAFDQKFEIITPTWNHLWYVVYVLVYSMIALAAAPVLRPLADRLAKSRAAAWIILLATPLPFIAYRFLLDPHFPTTHDLVSDWSNHAHRFTIFLLGFMIAKNDLFWRCVRRSLPGALGVAALLLVVFIQVWQEASWAVIQEKEALANSLRALRIVYAWTVIVALAGLGMTFLNRDSALLRYLTGAVFCWYILHQTITVAAGYYLAQAPLSWPVEFALLTGVTLAGCAAGYEAARRVPVLRLVFGVTEKGAPRTTAERRKSRGERAIA